ncbi:MAG: chlorophyll synthase ChlG [Proteobacteria bacterium]|nr:chlorophyll synthase ChlG [Pseudomonadota bacterium]
MTPADKPSITFDQPAASVRLPDLKVCLELLKPVTWFAAIWAFMCGVVSSGAPLASRWPELVLGMVLAGPMVCGTSQAVNDWFDRHVDAINEPDRPIPSGRMPGRWGLYIAIIWSVASLLVALPLGPWGVGATMFALAAAWGYSAPPFRFKMNGWWGNAAVALCYEGVPWFTGAAVMRNALPSPHILIIAALYSAGAHGIMTLNDFKSIEGDLKIGVRSLPAQLGVLRASIVACIIMAVPQVCVIEFMIGWHHPLAATLIGVSLLVQLFLMRRLLEKPRERAPWYNATGTTLYVLGMLVSAFALAATGV